MTKKEWYQAAEIMMGNLVRISIYGDGHGSGLIVPPPKNAPGNCCVLTALHVIEAADKTGATILIEHEETKQKIVLPSLSRYVFKAKDRDQAIIIFNRPKPFEKSGSINFLDINRHYKRGIEFGWLGYPGLEIAEKQACFFSGRVSAYLDDKEAYLVDGCSIHGVSGGPVFSCDADGRVVLAGIVTNYFPNEIIKPNCTSSQAWPGLAMFRTINPLMKLYASQNKVKQPQLPVVKPEKDGQQNK